MEVRERKETTRFQLRELCAKAKGTIGVIGSRIVGAVHAEPGAFVGMRCLNRLSLARGGSSGGGLAGGGSAAVISIVVIVRTIATEFAGFRLRLIGMLVRSSRTGFFGSGYISRKGIVCSPRWTGVRGRI